jgi:hypothetical protein
MQTGLARTLFFRRQEQVPGADYLTQNLGIEQTVIGSYVGGLKSRFRSREIGIRARLAPRSATPMKQIVNDDWTIGVAAATL